jgi:MTH538 TIR-like domain (DUF1863)
MARRVFSSFHYIPDNWRAAQVRSMGAIEGQRLLSDNEWEEVAKSDVAIKNWINGEMKGKSCVVVLVGSATAGRKWINYEITKGWQDNKGVVGIHIHNLKDKKCYQSAKGGNPFAGLTVDNTKLSSIVQCYDPPYQSSTGVYGYIHDNIEGWIEEAIKIRGTYW